jgi:hypothetical protein
VASSASRASARGGSSSAAGTSRKRKAPPAKLKVPPQPSECLAYSLHDFEPPALLEEEHGGEDPPPSRRRVAKPETWKRNLKKVRLEPLVSEKPPCSCSLRCFQRIGRDKRKRVRANFMSLARPQQKAYLRALIVLNKVKSKGTAMQMGRQRQLRSFTAEYHLKAGDKRLRVCLKAFIGILNVGSKQIKLLNTYAWNNPEGELVKSDQRGRHDTRPNRVPLELVAQVDAHIASFPRESSHYALATAKTFLASDLSVRKMHQLYIEKFEPRFALDDETAPLDLDNNMEEDEPGGQGGPANGEDEDEDLEAKDGAAEKPIIKYDFYNERFRTFDLAFGTPEVDSCATCDEFKLKIAATEDEDVANALREARRAHLLDADRGYRMRRHDQNLAQASRQADPNWVCPCEDYRSWDGIEYVCSDMAG